MRHFVLSQIAKMAFVMAPCFFAFGGVATLDAQPRDDERWLLPIDGFEADPAIPDSKTVLRYRWGDEISSHLQIERYLEALHQAAPDRTQLVKYGQSYEGRSLNYLVISSAENIARLDELRGKNLALANPQNLEEEKADAIVADSPVFVWLAYCVHGNEISPSDAALLTAYHLLADQREATKDWLKRLVVIIDPLQNPDGRDRFVNVFRESRGRFMQSHPYSNEHTERWPNGRSNHYWFDMNRDWFRHSQQEVKAKVAAYLHWHPQIFVDAHEMGRNSSYYFPPPTDPKNPYLLESQSDWFSKLGRHQAGWFDRFRFGYVTREIFDAFYPGYGSEWPTLQGGLGILWEQASARGALVDRDDETELTYRNGVRNHYVSGLATLEFAAKHRSELLRSYHAARQAAVELGRSGPVKHYFIPRSKPQRAQRFVSMLARNGIEVRTLSKTISVECTDVADEQTRLRRIAAGSYHIPVAQPTARLLRAILDRQVDMDDKFLRRQLERNQLRLPNEIYDVTAWSMPLAFGVPTLSTDESLEVNSETWMPTEKRPQTDLQSAQVAYLIPGTDGAIRGMAKMLQDGVRFHVADEPFRLNGRDFERGTLIAKVANNPSDLNERLQTVMTDFGVSDVVATDTAYVENGAHMGGPDVRWVKPPQVLLLVNRPSNYSSGHTWHLFDQVLGYPTTRVKGRDFDSIDLSKFNTIVLPDGRYSASSGFGKARAEALSSWIRKGGTLITLRGATRWASSKDIGLLKNRIVKRTVPDAGKSDGTEKSDDQPEKVSPDSVPGAFFRANVFQQHWVTYGFEETMDVFYSGNLILSPTSETGGRSLVTFSAKDQLLTSGFCWPDNLELMSETPYVFSRRFGRGQLIAFVDDPNFRAMYPALQRLFINAAMFGAAH